ncbi:site-specific integrase [Paraburkholderia graminis]|uniref:site-specific integrase n=1 Tax=Paraburkholderia graminis TaxID=60548 RepID=UPI00137A06E4|nr:site-specific integrase [Paraburkholderia graminis]
MKHPYLTTRSGSSHFYFRRKIPLDLQPLLELKEFWRSLETTCRQTAITRLPTAALEYEQLLAPARAAANATPDADWLPRSLRAAGGNQPAPYHPTIQPPGTLHLAAVQIPRLVERYKANALINDDETRPTCFAPSHPDAGPNDGYDDEAHRKLLLEARKLLRRARAADDFSAILESVEEHLAWERAWLPAASEEFATLLRAMADAQLAVVDEELRRIDGDIGATPELLPLVDENDTWSAAVNKWIEEAAPQPKTADEVRAQVARFERLIGIMPLTALTREHVAQFKTACLQQERVSKSRVNTILALLSPIINTAIKKMLTKLAVNPFAGAKFSKKAVRRDADPNAQRDAFRIHELNQLFASRVYVENYRPCKGGGEAAYWLPLLGSHSGARLEDLCQLRTRDVVQRAGVWCLHLHDLKREHRTGDAGIKRHVPIHRTLLELGWLAYVGRQDRDGLLFPELKLNKYAQLGAVWCSWFSGYLDDDAGLDDPRLDFHSFRHTFKAFAQLSGIENSVIEELVGHAPDSQYGLNEAGEKRLPFQVLVEAMHKLEFPGLELGHLLNRDAAAPLA